MEWYAKYFPDLHTLEKVLYISYRQDYTYIAKTYIAKI